VLLAVLLAVLLSILGWAIMTLAEERVENSKQERGEG
jgi:hypothetical protein